MAPAISPSAVSVSTVSLTHLAKVYRCSGLACHQTPSAFSQVLPCLMLSGIHQLVPSCSTYTTESFAGTVYPIAGKLDKESGRKIRTRIGPVKQWIPIYTGSEAEMKVQTAQAEYTLTTPLAQYKSQHMDALEQVSLCFAVLQTMKSKGKEWETQSFETVLAAVNRAKAVKGYCSVRDAILLNGSFILSQVSKMQKVINSGPTLENSAFISELKSEVWPSHVASS